MAEQCCERYDCSCDHHPEKKENGVFDLVDPVNTICVFVEGGVVQNVTGIPFGTKLMVVDYDTDGVDEQSLDLVKISEDEEPEQVNLGIYSHEARDGMGLTAEPVFDDTALGEWPGARQVVHDHICAPLNSVNAARRFCGQYEYARLKEIA